MDKKGLLFYLSGASTTAEYAVGPAAPTFEHEITLKTDEVQGAYLECSDHQLLAYRAPGNMYAERGTLSLFWRSRYPVGPTAFPIFRVGFADHSSWDACFLRIDYNGEGFDAFITDTNLSRARVHYVTDDIPAADVWTNLVLAWDENVGIRFYVNGKLVGEDLRPGVYFTGLDQFGPFSRIISHWQVQSAYNFVRGGDIAKVAVYDRMLNEEQIAVLAAGELADACDGPAINAACEDALESFRARVGLSPEVPYISGPTVAKKLGILDAYDLKRWWWKACDGIAETTWPGVYNRSRLRGRNDYFQLPDWDCYTKSGRAITFTAEEKFNHIEIDGSAYGPVELVDAKKMGSSIGKLFDRPAGKQHTATSIPQQEKGFVRVSNLEAEEPINDFSFFQVDAGEAPQGVKSVSYTFKAGVPANGCPVLGELVSFIQTRYTEYERSIVTAVPEGKTIETAYEPVAAFPFLNVVIPYEADDAYGMDGFELVLPARDKDVCYAVSMKDPLWYYRNLARFTFKVKAGEETRLYIDTRDRILPADRALYMTIACCDAAFGPKDLEGASLKVVYKSAADAKAEHVADRFTQIRDNYGHLVEEQPSSLRLNLFRRFYQDIMDLLKIDPTHKQAQYYYFDKMVGKKTRAAVDTPDTIPDFKPDFETAKVPDDVPAWAFKQIEFLKRYKTVINYLIDERQLDDGEFGGGLSDDGDFVTTWAYLKEMGSDPEKILKAMRLNMEAFYNEGMFTNGLPSIQADELHSSEEGLVSLNGMLTADLSNPIMLERAMETARSLYWVSGINKAGHRHIRSCYYSGSKMATDAPWNCQKASSFAAFGAVWQISRFNGNKKIRQLLIEFAEGMKAHYHEDTGNIWMDIRFEDDFELPPHLRHAIAKDPKAAANGGAAKAMATHNAQITLLEAAYRQTGITDYLDMLHFEDKDYSDLDAWHKEVTDKYEEAAYIAGMREYFNTEGSPWIDRVYIKADGLVNDRLGYPNYIECRSAYPSHRISWNFAHGDDEKIGILTPVTEEDEVKIVAYNISDDEVRAKLMGNEVIPGIWKISYGTDANLDDAADGPLTEYEVLVERGLGGEVVFPAKAQTVITMKLVKKNRPYADRCDLGICAEDVVKYPHGLNVRVHSLGNVDSPEVAVVLKNAEGKILKKEILPPMEAPLDLWPRYRDVIFNLHGVPSLEGCTIEIDPDHKLCEITRNNNIVRL